MATADEHGKNLHLGEAGNDAHAIGLALKVLSVSLSIVGAVSGILEFPNFFKAVILILIALFWGLFESNKRLHTAILNLVWKVVQNRPGIPGDAEREAQVPAIRLGLGGLLLLFLAGWGYGKAMEPPPVPETVYYMVVLDASEDMKEPIEGASSKWVAVRTAFQKFYEESHTDSNYGLVLIGGQNPQEKSGDPCSLPTVPLIPVVSKNGNVVPHRKLTLSNLQEQAEGQQPQGGGSLSRAFFLAKNQLESLPSEATKVIVLIVNATDNCEGRIDWDTLASEIELVNKVAIRKELILLDVEATQETTAFAEQMNAKNDPNMTVQVVQTYYQLEMSITFMLERNETSEAELETAATATAQSGKGPSLLPIVSEEELATPMVIAPHPPKPRRVIVAASATSMHTLTPTATSTFTPTLTFTPTFTFTSTATFTDTPTLTCTPTTPAPIIVVPIKPPKDGDEEPPPPPIDTCCMHCGADSQPCGDSCIALGLTCHQPPGGCACP